MLGRHVRSAIARFALAATVAFAALMPTQAAIYVSTFDPIDFYGVATFDVGDGCLAPDGFKLNDGVTCSVSWLDATVTLTDLPDTLATLTYSYAAFLPSTSAVTGIDVLLGELAGVHSAIIGPVVIAGDPTPDFNGAFSLAFNGDVVTLYKDGQAVATADAVFMRVDEPDGLALALLALGAAGFAIRSRRAPGTRRPRA